MRSLLQFLQRIAPFLLFVLLEVGALMLLFSENSYHRSILFSSANRVNARLYEWRQQLTAYFNLRQANEELWLRNGALEKEMEALKAELAAREWEEHPLTIDEDCEFVYGRVLKNSLTGRNNHILLDVGSDDGIEEGMGAVSPMGIAGMVIGCSEHYCILASVLNADMHFSCKIKGTQIVGPLSWNGKDIHTATLDELPSHVMWSVGDTVVTSGFSSAFAEGVPVGVIASNRRKSDSQFVSAEVTLFTRFESLPQLRLIRMRRQQEINELEKQSGL